MYAEHHFLPNSSVAKNFNELDPGQFMHNAFIAKNVCCDVLSFLNRTFIVDEYVNDTLSMVERTTGTLTHQLNPIQPFNLKKFLKECRGFTLEDFENSTIRQQIE
jgi:hypothetical protein